MKRLTTDTPNGNFETILNFVYSKDGWAYIRHDGKHENVRLTDWARWQCILHGRNEVLTETPEKIDERLCDCLMDGPICSIATDAPSCPIAMAYCFASQAVHLRNRLAAYEDTGLEPEEYKRHADAIKNLDIEHMHDLLQAEKDGRLVVLPEESS